MANGDLPDNLKLAYSGLEAPMRAPSHGLAFAHKAHNRLPHKTVIWAHGGLEAFWHTVSHGPIAYVVVFGQMCSNWPITLPIGSYTRLLNGPISCAVIIRKIGHIGPSSTQLAAEQDCRMGPLHVSLYLGNEFALTHQSHNWLLHEAVAWAHFMQGSV